MYTHENREAYTVSSAVHVCPTLLPCYEEVHILKNLSHKEILSNGEMIFLCYVIFAFSISEHMFYKLKVTVKYKLFKSKFIVKFNLLCY